MNYIFQNDNKLKKIIQSDGCFFRSCLHIAELEAKSRFDCSAINMLWDKAVNNGWLVNDKVKRPDLLIQSAIKALGEDREVFEVGIFKHGIIEYWPWVEKHPQYKNYKHLIQRVQTINGNTHYRVVDKFGRVIFDPYYPQPEIDFVFYSTLFWVAQCGKGV